jgi:hypothetical protein
VNETSTLKLFGELNLMIIDVLIVYSLARNEDRRDPDLKGREDRPNPGMTEEAARFGQERDHLFEAHVLDPSSVSPGRFRGRRPVLYDYILVDPTADREKFQGTRKCLLVSA